LSDAYYQVVHAIGSAIFWGTSRPVVLHRQRARRPGAFILAATHLSPFDVPLLMRHTPRKLDFVSIVEVFRNPFVARFYGSMNAFPLDRSKPDSPTVRIILDRLKAGRAVGIFPEGGIRRLKDSVLSGGRMRPSTARLAQMAGVPVVPAVVVNAQAYTRVSAWLPLKRIRYGVIYGEPIELRADLDKPEAIQAMEADLRAAFVRLHRELLGAMPDMPHAPAPV
jgi:1-acyl-sn-glycerol-3-phosphate acyltransferase